MNQNTSKVIDYLIIITLLMLIRTIQHPVRSGPQHPIKGGKSNPLAGAA